MRTNVLEEAIPTPVYGQSCILIGNDKLYLIAGLDDQDQTISSIQIFDYKKNSWQSINFNEDSHVGLITKKSPTIIDHQNRIYLFGGTNKVPSNELISIDVTLLLNTENTSNSISIVSTCGSSPSARYGHCACIWNNYMFIYGGCNEDSTTNSDMYQLDLATMTWSVVEVKGTKPSSRYQCGSCILGNQWYIFGGRSGNTSCNDLWCFNFVKFLIASDTQSWKEMKTQGKKPSPRYGCTMSAISQSSIQYGEQALYVFGGKTAKTETNPLFRLDLISREWNQLDLKETPRYYHTCVVRNSQLIVAGGSTSQKNATDSILGIDLTSDNHTQRTGIGSLSQDVFMEVLSYLDANDLFLASGVNRYWHKHTQNENLWRVLPNHSIYTARPADAKYHVSFLFLKNFQVTESQNSVIANLVTSYNECAEAINRAATETDCNKDQNSMADLTQIPNAKTFLRMQILVNPSRVHRTQQAMEAHIIQNYHWIANHKVTSTTSTFPVLGKLMAVGDGAVGKTCLLITMATSKFPQDYIPTVFDDYDMVVLWSRIPFSLRLVDTPSEDYYRYRALRYLNTTFVLVCFSVTNPDSFVNVEMKWFPEMRHFCPTAPIILVATKIDLRKDIATLEKLREHGRNPVTTQEGEQMAKKMGAIAYVETSAKEGVNVARVVEEGVNHVYHKFGKTIVEDNKKCIVM